MKILYTNFHANDGGGHVTYLMNLMRHLTDVDITVATPVSSRLYRYATALSKASTQQALTVRHQTYISRIQNMVPEVRQLRRHLRQQRYDLIHMNGSADHRHIMLACLGLTPRPALVFTKHNDHSVTSIGNRLRVRLGTDHVIAVSDYVRRLLQASSYRHKPITTIRHGIDLQYFQPPSQGQRAAQRRALFGEYHHELIVLGSTGGTDFDKGWLDLVTAVGQLPWAQKRRFRIVVAGAPPNQEKRERVAAAGMLDQVIFPGLLDDVRPLFQAFDMGFVLSYREALSYACREALAMGLPVLVSEVGGLPENLRHDVEGWIVPARQPGAIVPLLLRIAEDPAQLARMGVAARRRSEHYFDLATFVEATRDVYRQALARR